MSKCDLAGKWFGLAAALAAASLCPSVYAMGISPGVFVVTNVPLGKEISASDGVAAIVIHNEESEQPLAVVLAATRPREGGVLSWEPGYEEFPDASWCRLDKTELEVPAKGVGKANLFINVPDKPENYNRRWMLAVVCGQKPKEQVAGAAGAGIRLATRVGIETLPNANVDGTGNGAVALIPSVLAYQDCVPGETFIPVVKVRNNDKVDHQFTVQRLEQAVQDEEKIKRYFRDGSTPLIKDSWVAPVGGLAVKAGDIKELKFSVTIPKDAVAGRLYEEIVFLKSDAGRLDFVRLRMQIAGQAVAPKEK